MGEMTDSRQQTSDRLKLNRSGLDSLTVVRDQPAQDTLFSMIQLSVLCYRSGTIR